MNLYKHQWYVWGQHYKSCKLWSAIIRINTYYKLQPWCKGNYTCFCYVQYRYIIII